MMAKTRTKPAETAALRCRAEKQLEAHAPKAGLPRTKAEVQRLLHELQVHRVELEMQNEELRRTRDKLELQVMKKSAEVALRTRAEKKLREQSVQIRKLAAEVTLTEERERQRLAAVLHDEQQQLLVGAKLQTRLLERKEDPEVQEACREIIGLLEEALKHTRSLIGEMSPQIIPSRGLLPAVNSLAHGMKESHHLTVVVRAVDAQNSQTAVLDDHDLTILLFRAVRELLLNVVKHAQVQSAQVEIARRDGGTQVVVSDTGVGFDPASPRVESGLGGGFGLFSIRQRLEALGGRLEIDSTQGRGSRVMLWVPFSGGETTVLPKKSDPPGSTALETVPPVSPAAGRTGKIRVVVVDDHGIVRQGLVRLLNAEPDIEIVGEAGDGQTALALTRQLLPDVVTMDVGMPGMDGVEVTRRIHDECPTVQVIGLSMYDAADQAQAMRDVGAVKYLSKSDASESLVAAIRSCGRRKMEIEGDS